MDEGENQAENVEVKIYLLKKGCYSKKKKKIKSFKSYRSKFQMVVMQRNG